MTTDWQSRLEEGVARFKVAGASLALYEKGTVTLATAGVTNIETDVGVTTATVMQIGSITKVLNATLVMQLVDEGRVDLEASVLRYLPDLKLNHRAAPEQITVKMLLNHTSGIEGDPPPDGGHDEETLEKGVARFVSRGLVHRPGAEFSYSNAATVIAGYLVQRLRGVSWYRSVRERIFEPLEMRCSATLPEEAILHRASVGHFLEPESKRLVRTSRAFLNLSFAPCGTTLMLSAQDLITFARAHLAGGVGSNGARILSQAGATAMQQVTVNNQGKGYTCDVDVGLGWLLLGKGLLFHAGGGPGVYSVLYVHPQSVRAVAVLTNSEHGYRLVNELVEPWLQEVGDVRPIGSGDVPIPSAPVRINPDKYLGVYEDVLFRYRVLGTGDGLSLSRQARYAFYDSVRTDPTAPARLIPLGDDQFLLEAQPGDDSPAQFRIVAFRTPASGGRMQHLACGHLFPRVS